MFLQSMLEFGFIGLVISLMLYIVPFIVSQSIPFKERLTIIFLTLISLLQMLTNYINSVPIIIYLLVMIVLFSHKEKRDLLSENTSKQQIK